MTLKVYRSSAGSGKTYTLVLEYLGLVLRKPGLYRNILAVTFTNKAANELKERVLHSLWLLVNPAESNVVARNILIKNLQANLMQDEKTITSNASRVFSNILHHYSDFSISTIDSFAHRLVRTFTRDLNLPSQFEVELESEQLAQLMADILMSKIGQDEFVTETIIGFVMHLMNEESDFQVEKELKTFSKKLLKEEAYLYARNASILTEEDINHAKELILNTVNEMEFRVKLIADKMLGLLDSQQIDRFELAGGSRGIGSVIESLSNREIEKVFLAKTIHSHFSGEKEFIKKTSVSDLSNSFRIIEPQMKSCLKLLEAFYLNEFKRFNLYKLLRKNIYAFALQSQMLQIIRDIGTEKQIIHISEFNKSIARLLQNAAVPFIYERLGERYSHFLLDEFQDTSVLQWQNFLPLIENSLANANQNLIVGDGKQSIYRFRSGEVEQFLILPKVFRSDNQESLIRIEQLMKQHYAFSNLDTNYRSAAGIVSFNNDFFDFVKDKLPESMQFVYSDQRQKSAKTMDEGSTTFHFMDEAGNAKSKMQSYLDHILELVNQLVDDGYNWRDIAVLSRANTTGNQIARFLANHSIGVVSADSLLLNASSSVRLIINVMRFYLQPEDRINRTELMNNLYDFSIDKSSNDFGKLVIQLSQLQEEEQITALQKIANLNEMGIKGITVYDVVEQTVRLLNLESTPDPYIQFLMDEVHRFQVNERGSLEDFLSYWDEVKGKRSVIVPEETNAVKVMTIHKAKGLEFPVVILPFVSSSPGKNSLTEAWVDLREEGIGKLETGLIPLNKSVENTRFADLYVNESDKSKLDVMNVLYVAMTRPSERMYILSPKPKSTEVSFTYPVFFRDFLAHKDIWNEEQLKYTFGKHPIKLKLKNDIHAIDDNKTKVFISSYWQTKLMVTSELQTLNILNKTNEALVWGNLIHLILSEIHYSSDMEHILSKYIENGLLKLTEFDKVKSQIQRILFHPLLSFGFDETANIKTEVELLSKDGKVYRIDRLSYFENRILLIDYKTGAKLEKHGNQIKGYMNYVFELESKPVEGYLVYFGADEEIEVEKVS
ncbi:MAG: hypothetical protein CVT92_00270 [Bacteroidetes bacterium HGW-Bacteroidetes-1]|jgi:ATP-dependent exoDNAse (exonuclease V) beta subunit|nr:MAG: hypothetical protein CVT92_00270 [Bacteroidetes bacterium HGW-Bacteroidetes-1]